MEKKTPLHSFISKPTFTLLVTSFVVLCMDLISKAYMQTTAIRITKNFGAGFGILKGHRILLLTFTFFALVFLIIGFNYILTTITHLQERKGHSSEKKHLRRFSYLFAFGFGSIIGGALGNLYDRIFLGYVRDFIHSSFWPSFNIADTFISIGTFLVIALFILLDTLNTKIQNTTKTQNR